MQYLNSELGEGDDDSMRPGEGAFDDELSSMSLSPNGKGRGRGTEARGGAPSSSYLSATAQTFLANNKSSSGAGTGAASSPSRSVGAQSRGGRSYVWDEWQYDDRHGSIVSQLTGDDGDDGNGSSAQGGDNATYFSLRAGAGATSPSPSSSSSPQRTLGSHASKSVQHVVEELKVKIDAMKGQLQQKQARIKDLQSELARLHTAKTRREQKFKTTWASKLSEQREVQAATLKKSRDFVERISGDVKQLTIKRDGLKDKVARLAAHRESALQLLQEDAQRKAQRVRRQWEAEERSVFEKVLKGKEEALKKAAAESFGPALDKMVIEGKEAVRARQDEVTKRLEKLRRELALEVQDKLTQAREELRDQIRDDDEKSRRVAERKLQDLLRKHGEELDALKLKFQREKKMAEESAERTRRIDAETSLEGMREIRKSESQQVVEIMAAQQRELGQLVTNHGEAISALKASLAKEEEAFARRLRKELAAASEQNRDRAVSSLTARINAEADKVISKLREDIAAERKVVRDRIESELDDLRVSAQHRLDSMQMSENRSVPPHPIPTPPLYLSLLTFSSPHPSQPFIYPHQQSRRARCLASRRNRVLAPRALVPRTGASQQNPRRQRRAKRPVDNAPRARLCQGGRRGARAPLRRGPGTAQAETGARGREGQGSCCCSRGGLGKTGGSARKPQGGRAGHVCGAYNPPPWLLFFPALHAHAHSHFHSSSPSLPFPSLPFPSLPFSSLLFSSLLFSSLLPSRPLRPISRASATRWPRCSIRRTPRRAT